MSTAVNNEQEQQPGTTSESLSFDSTATATTTNTPPCSSSELSDTLGDDNMSFELTRNVNTEWLVGDGRHQGKLTPLLAIYVFSILIGQLVVLLLVPFHLSFTVTNLCHGFITMMYLHWIKGSPDFLDTNGGEMNGMTFWEQINGMQLSSKTGGGYGSFGDQRFVLFLVPTLLSYFACLVGEFDKVLCVVNVTVWLICIVAKMPFMHGVRLLGINRTAGVDDDYVGKNKDQ